LSAFKVINTGIVLGLGSTYTVIEGDIKPLSVINILFKYTDDMNLLVP